MHSSGLIEKEKNHSVAGYSHGNLKFLNHYFAIKKIHQCFNKEHMKIKNLEINSLSKNII